MASQAGTNTTAPSALTSLIAAATAGPAQAPAAATDDASGARAALHTLALQVQHNLTRQHDWTDVRLHTRARTLRAALLQNLDDANDDDDDDALPRPLLTGTPPRHAYMHPDVQAALIRRGLPDSALRRERAAVCPAHLRERGWSLARLDAVFEGMPRPGEARRALLLEALGGEEEEEGKVLPRDEARRVLLGIVDADSTVVYYWVHDGIVKPRQN